HPRRALGRARHERPRDPTLGEPAEALGPASRQHICRMSAPAPPGQPRLLDRVRLAIRARHYSLRTEEAYVGWVRRYVLFHKKRHPSEMGETEINAFVMHLASAEGVGASTQTQALSALLFLYRHVLGRDLPDLDTVIRAKRQGRMPTVLTRSEVRRVVARME